MNEIEQQGVAAESPTESNSQEQSPVESSQESQPQQQTQASPESQYVPYSRFKELVEERNTSTQQLRAYEQQLQSMQHKMQQWESSQKASQQVENPLLSRLKGIDPEFGGAFEKVFTQAQMVEQLQQRLADYESQSVRQRGVDMVNSLHNENKVPKDIQDFYNAQIEMQIRNSPNARLEDIPNIYKMVHSSFSKYVDSIKRSDKEAYVNDKKADSALPNMPKGKAATPNKGGFKYSSDPEEARKQMVENAMRQLKGARVE